MKSLLIALLTISSLSAFVLPSFADQGNSQTSTNISTVDGNGNNVRQSNRQSITTGRGRGDQANIQDALNDSLVEGNRNQVKQGNTQTIRTNRR